ncbi:beta family protein [Curtobacterium flaccumfaciens]|uniref:beta family protein n=1 Tax=Curtobacterium flaccumfaciens TaxID=2035 RepID=UPI003993ED0B
MSRFYRPFLAAKAGEAAALATLSSWTNFEPVLRIPSQDKDWQSGGYKKPLPDHLDTVITRIADAVRSNPVFIDIETLGTETPVHGVHPMERVLSECVRLGMTVRPLLRATSSPAVIAAAHKHNAATGSGVGVYVGIEDWETGASAAGRGLIASTGLPDSVLDVFVDAGPAPSTASPVDLDREVDALTAGHAFRSMTVGSAGFVDTRAVPKGLILHPRLDITTWLSTYGLRAGRGKPTVDFFDYGIENPWYAGGEVNPAFLSFSAFFRYTAGQEWVLAKGDLYKGTGGSGRGGDAMVDALKGLHSHPLYKDVMTTDADAWIDQVVAGTTGPSNPQGWRRWATLRHVVLTTQQVSSLA